MRVIAKKAINAYRICYPDADGALKAWVSLIENKSFKHFPELKEIFQTADLIKNDRIVFNIRGNHYRLIAAVDFKFDVVYIKWFGKHKDYDKIELSEVKHEYPPC